MISYRSTRAGTTAARSAPSCVLEGLAPDGGLYVPEGIAAVRFDARAFAGRSYRDAAFDVLRPLLPGFSAARLARVTDVYGARAFGSDEVVGLTVKGDTSYLDLTRGRTLAFKDLALSALPRLLAAAREAEGEQTRPAILTATSGDTGKAAMEAFAGDPDGARVLVFYPLDGVSPLQKLQMLSQAGGNVRAVAVRGNFDDAQAGVKALFADESLRASLRLRGMRLSSANSINIGRLLPQIVYYFVAYARLLTRGALAYGDPVVFSVPTGNFGDILAGYYAARMGLPIRRLLCASNENDVLTDFFRTGVYDLRRPFRRTIAPSMDILISSNFERLLYDACGPDGTRARMDALAREGRYEAPLRAPAFSIFAAEAAPRAAMERAMRDAWTDDGLLIDPHTASARHALSVYRARTGDRAHAVILQTASAFKFPRDVYRAVFGEPDADELTCLEELSAKSGLPVPDALSGIGARPRRAEIAVDANGMRDMAAAFLGGEA